MGRGLLIIERIILEALAREGRSLSRIQVDVKLKELELKALLEGLKERGLVKEHPKGVYALDHEGLTAQLALINSGEGAEAEVQELFEALIGRHFSNDGNDGLLKVKKLWMGPDEERIFQAHVRNLDQFIQNIVQTRQKRGQNSRPQAEKKVVFWGCASYEDVLKQSLGVS